MFSATEGFPNSPPATAEEEAYQHLLDGICVGRYQAGQRLKPEDIAAEIGMSRMPVREAFRRLAAEGLVILRPNRGAVVSGLNIDTMREVFEMRSVLEGLATRVAVPRLNQRHLITLQRLLQDMDQSRDDASQWVRRHRLFHEYLYSVSGRPRLMKQISALFSLIEPYMRLWLQHADKPRAAKAHHQAILDALSAGDAERAEAITRDHIDATVPALLDFLHSHEQGRLAK